MANGSEDEEDLGIVAVYGSEAVVTLEIGIEVVWMRNLNGMNTSYLGRRNLLQLFT